MEPEYIERETFLKDIEERHCSPCKEAGEYHNGFMCAGCWVGDLRSEVIGAPTADVAPVVHGHFVHDGQLYVGGLDWFHCSSCGRLAAGAEARFDYCPWCGARMDGDSDAFD